MDGVEEAEEGNFLTAASQSASSSLRKWGLRSAEDTAVNPILIFRLPSASPRKYFVICFSTQFAVVSTVLSVSVTVQVYLQLFLCN